MPATRQMDELVAGHTMAAVAFVGQQLSISHFAGHSYSPFGKDGPRVHLLSAFIHHQGITIAQQEISVKSNEIAYLGLNEGFPP